MDEPIFDRIPRLERAVRFWRTTSLVLAAILLSCLTTGFFFGIEHRIAQRAREQELIARDEAEAARLQAEQARQRQP